MFSARQVTRFTSVFAYATALLLVGLIMFVIGERNVSSEKTHAPGTLIVPASVVFNGTNGNDTLEVRRVTGGGNDDIQFLIGGVLTDSQPFANVDSITVNGLDGNDTLTVNYGASGGFFNQPLTFHGGNPTVGPGDKLVVSGGTFETAVSNYTSNSSGSITYDVDGNLLTTADQATISYDGLEPVDMTGSTINDLVFNLPSGTVGASLQDDGVAANNTSQLASTNATFETTNFAVPVKSLTVNAGGGTDTITTAAGFSGDFNAALTINGTAATDNVTLNALTLGNAGGNSGNLSVTGNSINVNGAIDTTPGSTGTVTMTARQTISVNSPGGIKTSGGNIDLSANQQATPASGSFFGVSVNGGTVQATGTGVVTVSGRGGDNAAGQQIGVLVQSGGVISGGTTGMNTITGTGGTSSSDGNSGVVVSNAASQITSAGGAVQVTGHGGGSGASGNNAGVLVQGGGVITAGGTGSVTILGNGIALSGTLNFGVLVRDTNSAITSGGGDVSVTGNGGGTGTSAGNVGVQVNLAGTITAGGTGTVTVQGTGGGGSGSDNTGVLVAAAGSTITSGGGNISVTGTPGSSATGFGADIGRGGGGSIASTGTGNITLTGDSMFFDTTNAVIDAGANIVTLQNKTLGTAISLGGADAPGTLGLTDAELDRVKAGKLRIGRNDGSASGNINLSSLIDLTAGANTISTLHLMTGAGVIDGTGSDQVDLKVGSLAIESVTGIGSSDDLDIQVANLAASNSGASSSGTVLITNTGALTIAAGGVDGVVGLTRSGGSASQLGVSAESPLTVNALVSNTTGGGVGLFAGGQDSNNAADVLTINANVTATGGDGFVILGGNSLVVNAATVSTVGAGTIAGQFGGTGSAATFNNGSSVTTVNGSIQINATTSLTLNGTATLQATGTGNIALTSDDLAIAGTATISASDGLANGNNVVTIQNFTPGRPIMLGINTAGTLGVTESELDRVKAETLRIGRNDASGSGNITLKALVDLTTASTPGGFTVPTLHLLTAGGVIDGISTSTNLQVQSLAIEAATGIGSTNDLSLSVTNLAFRNTTSGNVQITNQGALTITAVDTVNGTAGHEIGNFAVGGTTPLAARSPITFAINTSSVGPLSALAGESLPAAPGVDNVTVNAGVTVQSTNSGIIFWAGDDVVINSTATVQAGGNIDFQTGFNDNDSEGTMTLNGAVVANNSTGTVALNVNSNNSALPAGNIVTEGATGSITGAGLLLLNAAAGPSKLFSLDASTTNLVPTIAATTHAGISYRNNGPLTVGTVSSPPEGVTSVGMSTFSNNVTLATITGTLAVSQDLNTGIGGIVFLITPSNITGSGGLVTAIALNLDESGAAAPHTWSATSTNVTDNGGGALPYSGVDILRIEGGTASDTFNVTPSSNTTFNIHGNNPTPPASPGDSLFVDVAGTTGPSVTKTSTPTGFQGSFTFGNRQPVNFTTIETLGCGSAAPVTIVCPGGISRFTDAGQNSATVNPGNPVTSGGCGTVTINGVRSDGKPLNAPYPAGVTTITWTATDSIGNSASCSQTIVVIVPSGQRRIP